MPKLPKSRYPDEWETTITQKFDRIIHTDLSQLLRESSPEFNFMPLKEKINYAVGTVKDLASNYDYWRTLSDSKRQSVLNALDDVINQFVEMETFDPKSANPWDQINNTVTNFNHRYNGFYEIVASPLQAFLGNKAYSKELSGQFGKQAKAGLAEIRRVKAEIEKVQQDVNQAAEAAGEIASVAYTASFASQADEHKISASSWLKGLIAGSILGLFLALTIIVELVRSIRDDGFSPGTESYVFKLSILAFIYLGLRFIIKNYSAHQHLYIVNKQRANTLATMEAFRTSALSDNAKDEILLAAVGAAYSQQQSGFITTKEGAGSDDSDILEVVRSAVRSR